MKTMNVKITTIQDTENFAEQAKKVNGDVTLRRGRFVADAKSFLGIIAINVTAGAVVEYPETAADFEDYISQFKVG